MGSPAAHRMALHRRRLALLALVGLLLAVQMYFLAVKGVNYGLDLGPVWVSAENFLHRRPIYAGEVGTITFSFLPPSGALLTSPLGLVSFAAAAKAFLVVQIVVLAVSTVGVPITFGSDLVTNTRTLVGMLGIAFAVGLKVWSRSPAGPRGAPAKGRSGAMLSAASVVDIGW